MAQLLCTLSMARPLPSDILDLQVAEHGPDARVVTVVHEFALREDRDLRLVCHSQTANWALETIAVREHFTFTDDMPDSAGPRP